MRNKNSRTVAALLKSIACLVSGKPQAQRDKLAKKHSHTKQLLTTLTQLVNPTDELWRCHKSPTD